MLESRPIELKKDRDFLLNLYCVHGYEELPSWARNSSFRDYREAWLKSRQPEVFLKEMEQSLYDSRTMAEVWEESGRAVGFIWMVFSELEGRGPTVAEVRNLVVAPEHQRRGIGSLILQRAEDRARELGAVSMRSETAYDNAASQAMHGNRGFKVVSYQYEKLLGVDDDDLAVVGPTTATQR